MKASILAAVLALTLPLAQATTAQVPLKASSDAPAKVTVKGATTLSGAAPRFGQAGKPKTEADFEQVAAVVSKTKTWSLQKLSAKGELNRLVLRAEPSKAELELDVAQAMVDHLGLKPGQELTAQVTVSGKGAMIVFSKGETPLGVMVNNNTQLAN